MLGDDHETGRTAVEPVHDARSLLSADAAEIVDVMEQRIHQRSGIVSGGLDKEVKVDLDKVKIEQPAEDKGQDKERSTEFKVAKTPTGKLTEKLRLTVTIPPMGPMGMPTAVPIDADLQAAEGGAQRLLLRLPGGLTQRVWIQITGEDVTLQGFALPLGRGVADAGVVVGKIKQIDDPNGAKTIGLIQGTLRVGAEASQVDGEWVVKKAVMSRSARVLMEGFVRVPV